MDINQIIGFQVQEMAVWRWRMAKDFPNNHRNEVAAAALDRLTREIEKNAGTDVHRRLDALTKFAGEIRFDYDPLIGLVSRNFVQLDSLPSRAVQNSSSGITASLRDCCASTEESAICTEINFSRCPE